MINITWQQYQGMIIELDKKIQERMKHVDGSIHLIGIPRGGLLVALHLSYLNSKYELLDADRHFTVRPCTTVIVDDVLETGKTRIHWNDALIRNLQTMPPFAVLIDKSKCYNIQEADVSVMLMDKKEWCSFPYEVVENEEQEAEKCYGVK